MLYNVIRQPAKTQQHATQVSVFHHESLFWRQLCGGHKLQQLQSNQI
jgi:hypothetical protein